MDRHPDPPLYPPVQTLVATGAKPFLWGRVLRTPWVPEVWRGFETKWGGGGLGGRNDPGIPRRDLQGCRRGARVGRRCEGRWRGARRISTTPTEGIARGGEPGWRVPELRSWAHLGGWASGNGERVEGGDAGSEAACRPGAAPWTKVLPAALGLVALASSSPPRSGSWLLNSSKGGSPHPRLPWGAVTSVPPSSVWWGPPKLPDPHSPQPRGPVRLMTGWAKEGHCMAALRAGCSAG